MAVEADWEGERVLSAALSPDPDAPRTAAEANHGRIETERWLERTQWSAPELA